MTIFDSVAAVFCYQDRVFMVRRQPHLHAFPGYDSFPGGKIDAADPLAQRSETFLCDLEGQRMHALVREIEEELGYDLPAGIAAGQVSSVKFLAEAVAPSIVPVRFRLFFFRIDLESLPVFSPDAGEFADTFWETPQQALERFHQGNALMVPPLRWVLEALCRAPKGNGFGDLSPLFDEDRYIPMVEPLSGLRILPVPSNTIPPATRTNAFLIGDKSSPMLLVDPSPRSAQLLDNLLRTLGENRVGAILITHHHADHHELAPEVARRLNVPVWLSEDTRQRILEQKGSDYFSGVKVALKGQGDRVTEWQGEAVLVHEVPGHDAGQLALAPESLRWFIVGDLIQSIGTVVIAAPEGDMSAYLQTLEKVIKLNPAVIIPSHGMPMRGTIRLRATLQHRQDRERAIGELHVQGKTHAEMLDILYSEVAPHLLPLAMENIKSHMSKLRRDGKI